MTTGDTIMVEYNKKKYYIDIVETMPSSAVCIVETDCEADFATPLDYKEPEQAQASAPTGQEAVQGFMLFIYMWFSEKKKKEKRSVLLTVVSKLFYPFHYANASASQKCFYFTFPLFMLIPIEPGFHVKSA